MSAATNPDDPHAAEWAALVAAAEAVARSPACGPAECRAFCSAVDKLAAALMGEATEALRTLHQVCVDMDQPDQDDRPTEEAYLAAMHSAQQALQAMRPAVPA